MNNLCDLSLVIQQFGWQERSNLDIGKKDEMHQYITTVVYNQYN